MIITKTGYLSNPIADHDVFLTYKLEHNSQLLDSVCCALYSKKPWFLCFHSGSLPISEKCYPYELTIPI